MNGRVLVVCASRDRCYALNRMIESALKTSQIADIAVYIDEDQKSDYPDTWDPRVRVVYGPQIGPCKSLNELVSRFPGYEAYGASTDDSEFVTVGWDQWVLATARKFAGGIGGFHPYLIGAHLGQRMDYPWVTGKWIETIGWFCHPAAFHFYWDILNELIAEEVGIARAQQHEFAMIHDSVTTPDIAVKTVTDASNLIVVIGTERRKIVAALKEAACQPTS